MENLESLVIQSMEASGMEGLVLLAENGEPQVTVLRGYANASRTQPLKAEQVFPVASITKLVTAIAILQLVEEGKLDIHAPVNALLPEYDLPWPLSAHELLLHISGLPREPDATYEATQEMDAIITSTLALGAGAERSQGFTYNNLDYLLLGALLSRIDQKPWEAALRDRVLKPAGMKHAGFLSEGKPDGLVHTFQSQGAGFQPDPPLAWENYYAAGNMYATARDLLALDQALYGEILLTDQSKELLYTSYPEYNYSGYSVWTYPYPFLPNQPRLMERRGGIRGFNGVLLRVLDQNKTLIILSNNGVFNPDSFGDASNLKEAVIRAWAGPE